MEYIISEPPTASRRLTANGRQEGDGGVPFPVELEQDVTESTQQHRGAVMRHSNTQEIKRPVTETKNPIITVQSSNSMLDARFSCNICFDAVTEPVVTQCGHLYCWPCLYRWLEPGMYPQDRVRLGLGPNVLLVGSGMAPDISRRVCPVCKAGCSVDTIVPIYVRAAETTPTSSGAGPATASLPVFAAAAATTTATTDPIAEVVDSTMDDNVPRNSDTSGSSQQRRQQEQQQEQAQQSTLEDDVGECDEDSISSPTSSLGAVMGTASNLYEDLNDQPQYSTGLRQRRFATIDSHSSISSDVPRRPAPQSPMSSNPPVVQQPSTPDASSGHRPAAAASINQPAATRTSPQSHNNTGATSSSYGQHSSSLMLIPFRGSSSGSTVAMRRSSVPMIHRPEGYNSPDLNPEPIIESDPGATEFLSRILLMLGSFVILCLLLF